MRNFAFFLTVLVLFPLTSAVAQQVPSGACQVSGGWCWPLIPDSPGATCECRTASGTKTGVIK